MDNVFVDTNIWIYALIQEKGNGTKHVKTVELFEHLQSSARIFISAQIINEFHWVLSRKYKISDNDIILKVKDSISKMCEIVPIDFDTYLDSAIIREKYKNIILGQSNCFIIFKKRL